MSLFENTLKQIRKASKLMNLNEELERVLSEPQRIVEVTIPVRMDDGTMKIFKGFRCQHNNFAGPYKGGIRYHQQVDMGEVLALSAWMTLKNSVVGIPLGGGKGGIIVNPKELSQGELERLTRGYIQKIAPVIGPTADVPAPDVNTNGQIMLWIAEEYSKLVGKDSPGVVTGKPVGSGGSLGRDSATAQGGVYVLEEFAREKGLVPAETRLIIQGFGNAGSHMCKILAGQGYKIIGVSDSQGGIVADDALNISAVEKCKKETGSVINYVDQSCKKVTNDELLVSDCDLLIVAALENQLRADNAGSVKAKYILELANGPTMPEADEIFKEKGIIVIPDILANSGGVTVSYFEMLQNADGKYWTEEEVQAKLKPIMVDAWKAVSGNAAKYNCTLREGAFITSIQRLEGYAKEKGLM